MIITIDGPAGAGKSTVARILARRLGLPYLNSGYIYRAVTLLVMENGGQFDDPRAVEAVIARLDLRFQDDGEPAAGPTRLFQGERELTSRIKDPDVTARVYRIADNGSYRARLVELQRRFARPRGVVAEGRDMGTVIFPGADHRFYLDASPEERARRQHRELEARGQVSSFPELLESVIARDRRDSEREHAPLRKAEGARVITTDGLTVEDVVRLLLASIAARGEGGAPPS